MLLVGLLLMGIAVVFTMTAASRNRPKPLNVADALAVEHDAANNPKDPGAAVDVAIAYAAVLGQFGDMQRSVQQVRGMLAGDPSSAQDKRIADARAKVEAEYAKLRAEVGIDSDQEWQSFLAKGLSAVDRALARNDLTESQRAAAHLARGQLLLQSEKPKEAIHEAEMAAGNQGDPVMVALLKADAYQDMEAWAPAIKELNKASAELGGWTRKQPGWEHRLMWALGGRRGWRRETEWRSRKEELARNIQMTVAQQVQLLRNLEKLSARSREPE